MKTIKPKYQYAVIASDVVILTIKEEELKVLLIKMKKAPFAETWACPGGLVKPHESVDEAAQRLLFEKTGVKDVYLAQLQTFGKVDRDPFGRVVSVAYFALIPSGGINLKTTKEYSDVAWFNVKALPTLAYDHKEIIERALVTLKGKLESTNIVYSLLAREFTLSELQKIYELILEKDFDKRNFRKKIFSLNLIKSTGKKRLGSAHRPAELFRFVSREPRFIEVL